MDLLDGSLMLGVVNGDVDALTREIMRVAVIILDSDNDGAMALDSNFGLAFHGGRCCRHLLLVRPSPVKQAG